MSVALQRGVVPRRTAALLALSCLLAPATAPAADAVATLPTVVVTATRLPQGVDDTVSDVRVIDAQALRDARGATLADVLRAWGGAETATTGGAGQPASVFLRGTNSSHALVLVDGVRVGSVTVGATALESLPLEQIERIEVLSGPASGLYGADALGGVIQIFTRRGEGVHASAGVGRWDTRVLSAGVGRRAGDTRFGVHGSWRDSAGFSATRPGIGFLHNADDDGHHLASVNAHASHAWAVGHELGLRVLTTRTRAEFDAGAASNDVNRRRLGSTALESRDRLAPHWTSLLRLARGTDDTRIDGGFPSRFRTDQDQFTWQNDVDLPLGRVAAGAEARRERVASDTAYTRTRRTVRSAFAAWTGDVDAHTLEASLRVDHDSQFGTQPSARVGWGLALDAAWRVSAAAGTGFKAPTFADLYFPFTDFGGGFTYAGNPNLEPERSRSVEAGVRFAQGPWRAGATAFAQRIRDLIATNATGSTVENINRARIDGLTLDGGWRAGPWQATARWTHQRAIDEATDAWLLRRARNHASASLAWTGGPWRAGAQWLATGPRDDTDFATFGRVRLGGWGLVNLHAGWQMTPEVSLAARLSNAGNKRYEQVRHYATEGRSLFVSLEYAAR